ncbi:MAG: threonine synthase, partial [Limisphaerales bacterium]
YCPGMPLVGVLTVQFDYTEIRKRFDRSAPDWTLFSAVEPKFFPPYGAAATPFFRADGIGKRAGVDNLWIKNDGLNPSASLKDRASFLVVAEANRLGEETIVTASTGNAASALAAVCAAAGKRALIFVPEKAPKAKLAQMVLYGATVVPIKGTYDDAFKLSLEYTMQKGGLNRNTAYHPLTIEGKKTVGFEIFQQNGFEVPDVIVVPVGDGVIISGVYKAFYDLHRAGVTTKMPRLVCAQAVGSSVIHNYIHTDKYENAKNVSTIADSIAVSIPSNAHMARKAVLDTNGFSITVTDEEIMDAQRTLAATAGVFAEPAAATPAAVLKKAREQGLIKEGEQVVLLVTGHGLKDVDAAMRTLQVPTAVEPNISAVEAALEKRKECSCRA